MKISKSLKEKLVGDLSFTRKRMKEEQDFRRKMYYFSISYVSANRILNVQFDKELLFLSFVLQQSYQMISARVDQIQLGGDTVIPLPDQFFERLTASFKRVEGAVRKGGSLEDVLQDLVVLAYSTTGNGRYLLEQGGMELPEV